MSLFEKILNTNIINFLIVVLSLMWIAKKAKLAVLIENLALDIKQKVETSSNETAYSIEEYKKTKKETKDTPKLQQAIIDKAKNQALELKDKYSKKTQLQKEELKKSLEKIISLEQEKFKNLTEKEVYSACIDLAQKELIQKLDYELQKKLINTSIEELDRIEGGLC